MRNKGFVFGLCTVAGILLALFVVREGNADKTVGAPQRPVVTIQDAPHPSLAQTETSRALNVQAPTVDLTPRPVRKATPSQGNAASRVASARHDAKYEFGAILADLNIPPEKLEKIYDLLAEWFNTAIDARNQADEAHIGILATNQLVKELQAKVESEITALVDDSTAARIDLMLENHFALGLARTFASDFEAANQPIDVDQILALAKIYHEVRDKNPKNTELSTSGIDPETGLSVADRAVLEQAKKVINADQLAILRSDLARKTSIYVGTAKIHEKYNSLKPPN